MGLLWASPLTFLSLSFSSVKKGSELKGCMAFLTVTSWCAVIAPNQGKS